MSTFMLRRVVQIQGLLARRADLDPGSEPAAAFDDRGQSTAEYALVLAGLGAVIVGVFSGLGSPLTKLLTDTIKGLIP